mmetsp:Transcript_75662/g.182897  ORF Transcript_75662/g.182897 Transcript_75662/m.182897 type:complete len:236 (-) Transcript_75662:79-786(-)
MAGASDSGEASSAWRTGGLDFGELRPLVRDACAEAVREELSAGLSAIRQVVREELDREEEDDESSQSAEEGEGQAEEWKLVICVRSDLPMSVGKVAAQVGHAVQGAMTESRWQDVRAWEAAGSKKITLRVESEEQLRDVEREAKRGGLVADSIQDAGHTEVAPGTTTVLGIGPASAKEINRVTGHLKPLPDRAQQLERENKKLRDRSERLQQELDAAKRKQKRLGQLMRAGRHYI